MNDATSIQTNGSPSLKRPLEDSLSMGESIPAKKMVSSDEATFNVNNNIAGLLTEVHHVPENVVGLVIGKGGSEIKRISAMSGCRLQMDPDSSGVGGMRGCTIEGTSTAIMVAKQLINQLTSRSVQVSLPETGAEQTVDMMIPADKCGLVIGKSGETIKNLQEQSGCRIQMIQETQAITGNPKPLRIVGTPQAIELAKKLVSNVLDSAPNGNFTPNKMMMNIPTDSAVAKGEVIVPRAAAGMIIGKGGEMIKRLAMETRTKIQFKPDENPNSEDRCAIIMGSRENIYLATERITEIVSKALRQSVCETFFMHVPANKAGLVIGKGGETIRQIESESGACCGLAKSVSTTNDERIFEIRGTQYQIHHATHLIRIKVGDVQPNTPIPPMSNNNNNNNNNHSNAGNNQVPQPAIYAPQQTVMPNYQQPQTVPYPHSYGMVGQGQQVMSIPQQTVQPAMWNPSALTQPIQMMPQASGDQQYTQIQQQQQQTQSPNVAATAQSIGATPAINPVTGMPDYSAQWAAYYRSIGLLDQAAMVENQMKRTGNVQASDSLDVMKNQQQPAQFSTFGAQ